MDKNAGISKTLAQTRIRRKDQVCRTYELKVDKSHLSVEMRSQLKRLFLEAKWLYNHLLAQGKLDRDKLWNADYKAQAVKVKVKNAFEKRGLRVLSSQMRQEMIGRVKDNIVGLSHLKKNGRKVGALKFTSRVRSIPLNQHGITYWINGNRIHIQRLGDIRVRGTKQIPKGAELANATLLQKNGDYYVHVTTFQPKPRRRFKLKSVGTDLGIHTQLVLSNLVKVEEEVPLTDKIRRRHREFSRTEKGGKNRWKAQLRLDGAYDELTRQKKDIRNKISGKITRTFKIVCIQNDNFSGWQRMWGRKVLATAVGGLTRALNKAHTPIQVDRFYPSTKKCSGCGAINEIGLDEQTYRC